MNRTNSMDDNELLLRLAIRGARCLIATWTEELERSRGGTPQGVPQEASAKSPQKKPLPKKHNISPAGRQAIIDATKKRWAEFRRKKKLINSASSR